MLVVLMAALSFRCNIDDSPMTPKDDAIPEDEKQYCLYFDGQDDRVIVYDNNDAMDGVADAITLEAWINVHSLQDLVGRIIDRSDNQLDDRYVIEVYQRDNQPIVHLNINRNSLWSKPIPLKTWVHVAGTFDGQQMRLYLDGAPCDSLMVETRVLVNESDIYIGHGGIHSGHPGSFHGCLKELSIWKCARNPQQIRQDMKGNVNLLNLDLICYWPMQSDTGQQLPDLQHNAHGQLGSTAGVDADDPTWILAGE